MNIALIAHDKKKDALVQFATAYKNIFAKHRLFATGTTGLRTFGGRPANWCDDCSK
jgi:methylglyoxal synthase